MEEAGDDEQRGVGGTGAGAETGDRQVGEGSKVTIS